MGHYQCRRCGEMHEGPPLAYSIPTPCGLGAIPDDEWHERVDLTEDVCVARIGDEQHYFIRGNIELPLTDAEGHFAWTVWVSLSKASMKHTIERWDDPDRANEPPYFGWLCNNLPGYPKTLHLKTHVHTRPPGTRPYVELEPTDHPLAVEQREGIAMQRVQDLADIAMHGAGSGDE